ncbi:YkgJ family cysteine cluster protein [Halospeciosus flavus]|uniref:YkgJ family cysteine cluster protein n=1 Tax=Halospeciosus flavus TaxID=3032283 RepID=A0ABD5Z670_9EURY|nr:YkgJ family cysteine cluster protein [Halospeciosus flavus]
MESLEVELERARALDVGELADAIESIGFECTRCGACCTADEKPGGDETGEDGATKDPHTATVFPDEVRTLQEETGEPWRDVARPMPFGLDEDGSGETFEWALQTDACGDCTFYAEDESGRGECTVHDERPLICHTYPFSVALDGTTQPMGEAVDEAGVVRAHECEGLGRDISREDAEELAAVLKERAVRELEEAIGVRDNYEPVAHDADETVVYDSEGPKHPDGTPYAE